MTFNDKMDKSLDCKEIEMWDDYRLCRYLNYIGFSCVREIMDMRVFDLMNINTISGNLAEEIVGIMLVFFKGCETRRHALFKEWDIQEFDVAGWRKKHRPYSAVRVCDIVLADGINDRAITPVFSSVKKAFYQSAEYSSKGYRFLNQSDYTQALLKRYEQKPDEIW